MISPIGVEAGDFLQSIGHHVRQGQGDRVEDAALKRRIDLRSGNGNRHGAQFAVYVRGQAARDSNLEAAQVLQPMHRCLGDDVVRARAVDVRQVHAHVLVLRLEETRIELLEHQARDLGRGKQERQLRRVQQLETARLIGAVGVGVIGDAGDRRLEAVDGTMKHPVGERLQT